MTDIITRAKYDELEDKLIVHRVQDVEPILKQVERERQVEREAPGLGRKVGTIPGVIIEQYLKENGVTYEEFIRDNTHINRIMMDPDYKKFRVWEGKL